MERGRFAQSNSDAPARCRLSRRRGRRRGKRRAVRRGTPLHPRALPGKAVPLCGTSRAFGPCGRSETAEPLLEFRLLKDPEVLAPNPRGEVAPRAGPARRGEVGRTGGARQAAGDPGLSAAPLPTPLLDVSSCLSSGNQPIILRISQTGEPGLRRRDAERRRWGRTRWFFALKIIYFMSQSLFVKTTNIQFGLA